MIPNPEDLSIWDGLFADAPEEWRTAPPSTAMETCAAWLRERGAHTILDLGCGVGRWTVWLKRQGFESTGVDFAPNGIAQARAWAAAEHLDIPFAVAPVTQRSFPDRRFDAVVATLVLDLISTAELGMALQVIRTSLQPRGYLFAVFNPVDPPAPEEAENNPTAGVTLIPYTDDEINHRVSAAGFELLRRRDLDLGTRGFLWQRSPRPIGADHREGPTRGES